MSVSNIKKINRDLCKDFCDLTGKTGNYTMAWVYAIVLDIVIPFIFFLVGIGSTLIGIVLGIIIPAIGGIVVGAIAIVIFLIALGAMILVSFLLFREIGLFILIPIGANALILILGLIPIINILSFVLMLFPWNIIAVVLHMVLYGNLKLGKTEK